MFDHPVGIQSAVGYAQDWLKASLYCSRSGMLNDKSIRVEPKRVVITARLKAHLGDASPVVGQVFSSPTKRLLVGRGDVPHKAQIMAARLASNLDVVRHHVGGRAGAGSVVTAKATNVGSTFAPFPRDLAK